MRHSWPERTGYRPVLGQTTCGQALSKSCEPTGAHDHRHTCFLISGHGQLCFFRNLSAHPSDHQRCPYLRGGVGDEHLSLEPGRSLSICTSHKVSLSSQGHVPPGLQVRFPSNSFSSTLGVLTGIHTKHIPACLRCRWYLE